MINEQEVPDTHFYFLFFIFFEVPESFHQVMSIVSKQLKLDVK